MISAAGVFAILFSLEPSMEKDMAENWILAEEDEEEEDSPPDVASTRMRAMLHIQMQDGTQSSAAVAAADLTLDTTLRGSRKRSDISRQLLSESFVTALMNYPIQSMHSMMSLTMLFFLYFHGI
eukprot:15340471-Ditylum_brightwellii.AAC.1